MQVRKGYWLSDVGIIPMDWSLKEIRDVAVYRRGSFPQPYGLPKWYDELRGMPFVQVFDVDSNMKLKNDTKQKISDLAKNKSVFVEKGSIVLTLQGSIGRIAITQYDAYLDRTLLLFKSFLVPIDKWYFMYTVYQLFQIEKLTAPGGIIKTITKEALSSFKIPLPPTLAEQTAIATALSDADALITSLEKLIAKKRNIKQGTMQQLLTGKKRLPGFIGKLEMKKLGEIADISRGASPRPIDDPKWFDDESEIGWVRISDVTNSVKYLKSTTQKLSELGISKSKYIKSNNVIMSICATVGRPVITKYDVCIHDGFVIFANLQADIEFLYYYLSFIEYEWSRHGQTGSQMNLNTEIIKSQLLLYPSIEEQTAIAQILSDMDAEIESLERKLDKYKLLKQGMMQELLTGKIRLNHD